MYVQNNAKNIEHIENAIKETECSLKDIPFNPHCSACCSQPLRKQLKKLPHTICSLKKNETPRLW